MNIFLILLLEDWSTKDFLDQRWYPLYLKTRGDREIVRARTNIVRTPDESQTRWATTPLFGRFFVPRRLDSVFIFQRFLLSLELICISVFSASPCSVSSWVISTSTLWRPPIACLVQSSSSPTCSSCSLCCSTCSWPSSTTPTLRSNPTSPRRRASSRSETISRR